MVNFFFFRADTTRNQSASLVATLLFQLFRLFPQLEQEVTQIIAKNDVILRQPTQDQFLTLIEEPLRGMHIPPEDRPIMLIDGLDECGPEPGAAQPGTTEQSSLLHILDNITKADSPFIVLVASRDTAHLTMTFREIGYSSASIYLDHLWDSSNDIRQYLVSSYSRIENLRMHSSQGDLGADWSPMPAIDSITHKSLGHFAFAAAIVHFIETSHGTRPKDCLEIMVYHPALSMIPPFTTFDKLCNDISAWAAEFMKKRDNPAANKSREAKFKLAILPGETTPFLLAPVDGMKDYRWLDTLN